MGEDVKIIQDVKILQQIISQIASDKSTINIFLVGNITNGNREDFDLERYLESLTQPRLKNLISAAIGVATKKFHNDIEAGHWLGGTRKLITYEREKQNKEVI